MAHLDDLSSANGEVEWLSTVSGAVELRAICGERASVVHAGRAQPISTLIQQHQSPPTLLSPQEVALPRGHLAILRLAEDVNLQLALCARTQQP